MPELPDRTRQSLTLILSYVFTGAGPTAQQARWLAISFVRVLDKAVDEYGLGRRALDEQLAAAPNHISSVIRAIGHLESCINALHRCLIFASHLRGQRLRQAAGDPIIPRPKDASVLSKTTISRVREMRNAIEHVDGDIVKGRIVVGDAIALVLTEDHVQLRGESISYAELADWIGQLREIAQRLIHYRELVEPPPTPPVSAD